MTDYQDRREKMRRLEPAQGAATVALIRGAIIAFIVICILAIYVRLP